MGETVLDIPLENITKTWKEGLLMKKICFSAKVNEEDQTYKFGVFNTKNWLKDTGNLSADILNHKPDWLLFSLKKFESAENCLYLLDNVKRKSAKRGIPDHRAY